MNGEIGWMNFCVYNKYLDIHPTIRKVFRHTTHELSEKWQYNLITDKWTIFVYVLF